MSPPESIPDFAVDELDEGTQPGEALTAENEVRTQVLTGPTYWCGKLLGEILKGTAGLTQEKLDEALALQAEKGGRLGDLLVGLKAAGEEDVAKALGLQLDLPFLARIFGEEIDPELIKKVPINFA